MPETTREELAAFVAERLEKARQALKARQESAAGWRTGTDDEWREAADMHPSTRGKYSTAAERQHSAEIDDRIAVKMAVEVERYEALSAFLRSSVERQWEGSQEQAMEAAVAAEYAHDERLSVERQTQETEEDDSDIPVETRRELMHCATSNGRISYWYLCDVWRRGRRAGTAFTSDERLKPERWWEVYDWCRDIQQMAQRVSERVDEFANLVPDTKAAHSDPPVSVAHQQEEP